VAGTRYGLNEFLPIHCGDYSRDQIASRLTVAAESAILAISADHGQHGVNYDILGWPFSFSALPLVIVGPSVAADFSAAKRNLASIRAQPASAGLFQLGTATDGAVMEGLKCQIIRRIR